MAITDTQQAERLGAKGVLLPLRYLTEAAPQGIVNRVEQVCKSIKIGVIVYNRGQSRLSADRLAQLAERCPTT